MMPSLEEALRMLRLAERDLRAFDVLRTAPGVHISMACFHAQQAVEKYLKAVLFFHLIPFRRSHDLIELADLLDQYGVTVPATEEDLSVLNPFAVTVRYDDQELYVVNEDEIVKLVDRIRGWAERLVVDSDSDEQEDES